MDLISFGTGALSVLLAYAIFSATTEDQDEMQPETESEILINGVSKRLIEMSCQTCRKLKNHREIESGVFECTKCHRRIYTR